MNALDALRRRSLRAIWASIVAVGALAVLSVPGAALPMQAPDPAPEGELPVATEGLDDIATCALGSHHMLVELLIDQSGSLAQTDPDGDRVTASLAAAEGLAQAVDDSGGALEIDFSVAGFDGDYRPGSGWRRLDRDSLDEISDEIAAFEERNDGIDTDYVNALQGAASSIAERAGTDDVCKVVVWFTDGHLDIADRIDGYEGRGADEQGEWRTKSWAPDIPLDREGGGAEAEERAQSLLCDDGGIADQLRNAAISVVALPLTANIQREDVGALGSIAVSPYAGASCGSASPPSRGAVLPADSVDDLVRVFDKVAQALAGSDGPDGDDAEVCAPGEVVEACTRTFQIDDALLRFHVLVATSAPDIAVWITAPDATEPAKLPATGDGEATSGDVALQYRWVTDSIILIDGARPTDRGSPSWTGTWTLTFVDTSGENPDAVAESELYLFGDLVPQLDEPQMVRMGDEAVLTVSVRHRDGTPEVDDEFVRDLDLTVTVNPGGDAEPVELPEPQPTAEPNVFTTTYEVPNPSVTSRLEVTSSLVVETVSGIRLAPTSSRSTVRVQPPATFPEVLTDSVQIGPITGTDPSDDSDVGEIVVKGSATGDGCVWIEAVEFEVVPTGVGGINSAVDGGHSTADTCLDVPRNEEVTLRFSTNPTDTSRGLATGKVGITLSAEGTTDTVSVPIPVQVELRRPVKIPTAIALLVVLMVAGVGLPFLALWLTNRLNAHFEDLGSLSVAVIPVAATAAGATRLDGKTPLVSYFDFDPMQTRGRRRSFVVPAGPLPASSDAVGSGDATAVFDGPVTPPAPTGSGGYELHAVAPNNPFRPPFGVATGPAAVLGSEPQKFSGTGGRIPLGLSNAWFFAIDPAFAVGDGRAADEVRGHLVCFGESTDLARVVQVLVDDAAVGIAGGRDDLLATIGSPAPESGEGEVWDETGPGSDSSGPPPPSPQDIWGGSSPAPTIDATPKASRREKRRAQRAAKQASAQGSTAPDETWTSPTTGETPGPNQPGTQGGSPSSGGSDMWEERF